MFRKTLLFTLRAFGILPMVPLEILPMVPLVANGTIGNTRTLNVSRLPMVPLVPMLPLVETLAYSRILQLQTGYTYLNDYRSKINQTQSNKCICGQVETTEHYLLQCPLQDVPRDIMARNLGQKIGLYHLDLQHILGYEDNNNIPGYQETVKSELAEYIRATGRFISSPQAPSSP